MLRDSEQLLRETRREGFCNSQLVTLLWLPFFLLFDAADSVAVKRKNKNKNGVVISGLQKQRAEQARNVMKECDFSRRSEEWNAPSHGGKKKIKER